MGTLDVSIDDGIMWGWQCRVCGVHRHFDDIALHDRDLPDEVDPGVTARLGYELKFRVAYCVDNPECVAWATAEGAWEGSPDDARDTAKSRRGRRRARSQARGSVTWPGGLRPAF